MWLSTIYLGPSLLISLLNSIYVLDFTSTGFISVVLWHLLLHLFTVSSNLLIDTFLKSYICKFYSLSSNKNYFSNNRFFFQIYFKDFYFYYVLNTFLYYYSETMTSLIYFKISNLYLPIFYFSKNMIKLFYK